MRYCEINKEMSSLYFGLAVFYLFESSVLDFDTQPLPPNSCGLYSVLCKLRRYSQSGNDRDEMAEIKKSRVSCFFFFYIHQQSDTV
jgi:hypothetical protein